MARSRSALELVPLGQIEKPPPSERVGLLRQIACPLREATVELVHDATPQHSRTPIFGGRRGSRQEIACARLVNADRRGEAKCRCCIQSGSRARTVGGDEACARRGRQRRGALRLPGLRRRSAARSRRLEVGGRPAAAAGEIVAPEKRSGQGPGLAAPGVASSSWAYHSFVDANVGRQCRRSQSCSRGSKAGAAGSDSGPNERELDPRAVSVPSKVAAAANVAAEPARRFGPTRARSSVRHRMA